MAAQSASSAELVTSLRFASDPGANFVDPLLQFRKVRPRPVYLFAASTAAELVVIDCGERLEFADYRRGAASTRRYIAGTRKVRSVRKVKTAINFIVCSSRWQAGVTSFDDCVHQRTPVSRSARCSRVITSGNLIVLRLGRGHQPKA
jgi:hypothetical protein